jgi:phosphohistidine phosphatase
MNLYLMRHAHAVEPDEWRGPDSERPLIEKGRRAAEAAATGLARRSPPVSRVITSPYTRAADTAEIVATRLGVIVTANEALALNFDLARLAVILDEATWASDLLLVGHQPNMGQVLAALLGRPDRPVELKKAAVALVTLPDGPVAGAPRLEGAGALRWLRTWRELGARESS